MAATEPGPVNLGLRPLKGGDAKASVVSFLRENCLGSPPSCIGFAEEVMRVFGPSSLSVCRFSIGDDSAARCDTIETRGFGDSDAPPIKLCTYEEFKIRVRL
jgi:hypothetical protein